MEIFTFSFALTLTIYYLAFLGALTVGWSIYGAGKGAFRDFQVSRAEALEEMQKKGCAKGY